MTRVQVVAVGGKGASGEATGGSGADGAGGFGNVYSVGDLLLSAGVATLVYGAMRGQYARPIAAA